MSVNGAVRFPLVPPAAYFWVNPSADGLLLEPALFGENLRVAEYVFSPPLAA